ncbi:MAG: glutamine synthetase type III, partial [Clostridiales Family XIII bacterium]|nr:glutamine synthetase type III [Clostridiales Family XIII bacterium]
DRNRTSPFAFTGNKFEFRMVGSSLSVSGPCFILNTIVADVLREFADQLEAAPDFTEALATLVKETIVAHERIIFNGNGYSEEWVQDAEARGLLNLLTTVDALPYFIKQENIDLFDRHGVLSLEEMESRYELLLEAYSKILHIESNSMLEIVHRGIVPAVVNYTADVADSLASAAKTADKLGIEAGLELHKGLFGQLTGLSSDLHRDIAALEQGLAAVPECGDALTVACHYKEVVIPAQEKLRATVDALEQIVDADLWPLPSYGEILYSVK